MDDEHGLAGHYGIRRLTCTKPSSMDMTMLSMFNGRERERDDWILLFQTADRRFSFVGTECIQKNTIGVVVFEWLG